ncbi:hypothetical protein [Paenibacillus sp. SI8]|uniref:hypothetical protein n=1 Tax=unclassified Paenibacillus TaxID=185978 RepID=UPI00346700F8
MVIESKQLFILQIASNVLLFVLMMTALYHILLRVPVRAKRWRSLHVKRVLQQAQFPPWLTKLLGMNSKSVEEKQQLLYGCGIRIDGAVYEGSRRLFIAGVFAAELGGYLSFRFTLFILHVHPIYIMTVAGCCLVFLLFDKKMLHLLKEQRAHRIVKEIYVVSHHLLYYNDSHMNLHGKLSLCAHQTRSIRPLFQEMLNEWYQDAEAAIHRFKIRLGTDEAYSFSETLNALRLNEHGSYYELLKQRIQDYKEKMELVRDSRKETVSYVLFVLAGLPILNTFRVFMYPWIAEGQRLFEMIN